MSDQTENWTIDLQSQKHRDDMPAGEDSDKTMSIAAESDPDLELLSKSKPQGRCSRNRDGSWIHHKQCSSRRPPISLDALTKQSSIN